MCSTKLVRLELARGRLAPAPAEPCSPGVLLLPAAFPPGGDALVCAAEDGDGEVLVDVASTSSVGGDA